MDLINLEDPVFIFQIAIEANNVIIVDNAYINIVSRSNSLSRIAVNSLLRIKSMYTGIERILHIANTRKIHKESYMLIVMLLLGGTFAYLYQHARKQNRDFVIYETLRLYHAFKGVEQFTSALREGNYALFTALAENDANKLVSECDHLANLFSGR